MPQNLEDLNLSFGVQEVPIAHVNDEGPGQEPNREQSSVSIVIWSSKCLTHICKATRIL